MSKNLGKILIILTVGMAGGIFADQVLWPYFVERPLFYQYQLEPSQVFIKEKKEIIIQENTALENAVVKVEKAVIGVRTKEISEGQEKILEGSGLVITTDGLVVTLASLVPQGAVFAFFADDKPVSFQILKRDLENNLALIKIGGADLPVLSFADLEKVELGERVFLVKAVFENKTAKKMVNAGIISGFDENSIQTNIFEKINSLGSSLFDIEGSVLGLNILDKEGRVITIPISKIKQFIGL